MKNSVLYLLLILLGSCTVSKNYNPARKFGPEDLREDFMVFRNMLEESHPSLYWYTSKDSIDYYFNEGYHKIQNTCRVDKAYLHPGV